MSNGRLRPRLHSPAPLATLLDPGVRYPPLHPGAAMTLAELQRLLTSVEPAAVLVPPRVMEHVVRHALQLSPMTWTVPHVLSWIVEKPALYRWIDHADLPIAQDLFLPPTIILLAWPDED